VDFSGSITFLQQEIDHIDNQVTALEAVVDRIDLTGLTGDLVITDDNKNSVLLTAIEALQDDIGGFNKLDLSALPNAPPATCIITPSTTNDKLKILIDDLSGNVSTLNIKVTDLSNNVATLNTKVIDLSNNVTSINNSITAINAKLAHITVYTVSGGATTMTGIRDGTGFAVDLGGNDTGNGLFVYPNNDQHNSQIRLETSNDKKLYLRGGGAVEIYAGTNGTITARNSIFIGDVTDNIKIGSFTNQTQYPLIEIGDPGAGLLPSTTRLKGDVYLTQNAVTSAYDQLVYASGNPSTIGKLNNTTAPNLSGLTVTTVAGFPLVSITQLYGAITLTTGAGLISLLTGVGGINMTCGGGAVAINTGGGAVSINCGAGVLNMASGTGSSNWTTANGDVYIGAGKGTGGSAGNVTLNAVGNISIQPDASTNIFKTEFIEMNTNATTPATTTRRIYDICGNLWYNGQQLTNGQDPSGIYVLKTGDTMTGNLNVPTIQTTEIGSFVTDLSLNSSLNLIVTPTLEGRYNRTGYIEFNDNQGQPAVTSNRLYQQGNQLFFDGSAIGGGGGNFLPLTGGTLTGQLISSYDAGQTVPQLQLSNTNNTAPVGGQGAQIAIRNDATGAGSVGERCGIINFQGKDSLSAGGRTYANIQGFINDPSSTAIDGRLSVSVASNNTTTEMLRLVSTSTSVRQINLGATNTIIGASAIGASTTDTLRVQGSTSITTTLDVPTIQNAVNIYPATSSTLIDNAVRQYQPERLYKLTTYPEPLGPPTRDGEKVYFVNPTGNPVTSMDKLLAFTDFQSLPSFTGNFTWEYIQKSCFYKGSSVTGGVDAWYYSCKFNDGNSYIFAYIDFAGQIWKLYGIAKIIGEVNDMCVGNPAYQGGGLNHRIYVGGSFASGLTSNGLGFFANNVVGINTVVISQGGIASISINDMSSAKDPAVAHEQPFTSVVGVSGVVNCIWNASGLNTFGLPTNADIIVIGGQFYQIGASGGTLYRGLASIAWYNTTWTSGLQTDQIGWSTLDNNQRSSEPYVGVGTSSQGESVLGVGFWSDGWGAMIYSGTTFNNETGTVTTSNSMVYFYHASGSVSFQIPNSDAGFIETGQTFPKENAYNTTNVIKGGTPSGATAQYGDYTFETLAVTNGLTPAGNGNWGINWRPISTDPYQTTLCLVIDNQSVNSARQPLTQFSALQIVGFYSNQTVYPDQYFLGTFLNGVYEGFTLSAPFNSPNYASINIGNIIAPIRSFASHSTILGYTGLNMYGNATAQDSGGCVWIYKTTSAGDLTVELSGCLVRTAPNIYARDTITFLGVSDGSSLMLLGDTSTTGNPEGKPSWWAISQDGAIKYDNTTVDSGGINSIVAGTGISEVTSGSQVTISNTGVTSIVAGTNVTISSTGTGGTGEVTINATASAGTTTGFLSYYLQSTPNGGAVVLSNNTNGMQSFTNAPAYFFLPNTPRVATGIATQFDLYNDGSLPAGTGWIRWTGSQSVTFQMTVPCNVTLYAYGTSNRISFVSNGAGTPYIYSNFYLSSEVRNSVTGMENTDNPQRLNSFGASNISTQNAGVSGDPFDYQGLFTFNGVLRQNDYIKIFFSANSIFNQAGQSPANTYSAFFSGQLQTLTVQYTDYT
jgi:hypothetical protein